MTLNGIAVRFEYEASILLHGMTQTLYSYGVTVIVITDLHFGWDCCFTPPGLEGLDPTSILCGRSLQILPMSFGFAHTVRLTAISILPKVCVCVSACACLRTRIIPYAALDRLQPLCNPDQDKWWEDGWRCVHDDKGTDRLENGLCIWNQAERKKSRWWMMRVASQHRQRQQKSSRLSRLPLQVINFSMLTVGKHGGA